MDKRFFLTIALCFLAAYVWMQFVVEPQARRGQDQTTQNQATQQPAPHTPPTSGQVPNPVNNSGQPVGNQPNGVSAPAVNTAPPPPTFPDITSSLSNELVDIEISSMGATLTRMVLKAYKNEDLEQSLDLLSPERMSGKALGLHFDGSHGVPWDVDNVPWQLESSNEAEQSLRYRLPLPDGRSIIKTLWLRAEEYVVDMNLEFVGNWPQHLEFSTYGPERLRHDKNSRGVVNQCVYGISDINGRFAQAERRTVEKLDAPATLNGVTWAGLETNYFAFVLRPVADTAGKRVDKLIMRQTSTFDPEWAKSTAIEQGKQGIPFEVGFGGALVPGQVYSFEAFGGPKDRGVLAQYSETGFGELIDYGSILGWLVWLFLLLLGFFHSITGSFGIAIIFLTVVVKVLLHPINKKNQGVMMRQQKKMAKIQPQMQELKEKHKNDSMKANREIQKLLKENDVNPAQMFGGCLLMLLQLPIWIALINTFSLAIDLRQESFLYITDLTLPDRLFALPGGGFSFIMDFHHLNLLPFLYVIMTLISQRMMPRSSDPQMQQQQKMMTFMMVAFGFIFYNFSSGLLLYFMTSAALGIVEQKIIRAELKAEGL
ncbi:MAG: membrane protein insertase YidC [Planctomycetota bacterium]